MQFRILGPLEVRQDGAVLAIGGRRRRALLTLLLLRADETVPFDVIVEELWGFDAPRTARAALQNQASALRRVLGAERLITDGVGYRLRVEPGELDLHEFADLVAEGRAAEPNERADRLAEALSLWRGLPLVEFPLEPFAQTEIVRLEELRLSVVEERIEADLANGRAENLVGELESLLLRNPLRERLWAFLMLALYHSGRQAEALSTYRRAHRALVEELGIEPGPKLKELQRRILLQDPLLAWPERGRDLLQVAAGVLPVGSRERVRSLVDYAHALRRLGENAQATAALEEAERRATALGDRVLLERARLLRTHLDLFEEGASLREHLRRVDRAVTVFNQAEALAELADAFRIRGQLLRDLGRAKTALTAFERSIAAAAAAGDRWQEGMSRNFLATALAHGPTPVAQAIAACEEHLGALEWDSPPGPTGLWASLGELLFQAGQIDEGRELVLKAQEACREAGLAGTLVYSMLVQARLELTLGDNETPETILREAGEILKSVDARGGLCLADAELAYAIGHRNADEAERLAEAARRLAAEDDFSAQVAWRRALGRLRPGDEGRSLLEEAAGICEGSDFLNLHAATLEDVAQARSEAGDPDGAEEALEDALRLYERKGNALAVARIRAAPA
jgi:DNA-binding SARP family transcriptional activator